MKKLLLMAAVMLTAVACNNKPDDPVNPQESDPRDAFVGEYTLSVDARFHATCSYELVQNLLPDTLPMKYDFDMKIEKDSIDDTKVHVSGFYNCDGVVTKNKLILETSMENQELNLGELTGVSMLNGIVLPVSYTIRHDAAVMDEAGVIAWRSDGQGSGSVSVMSQSVSFTLTGPIYNTATRKQ